MKHMNDYDLDFAIRRFDAAETTARLEVARLVARLATWTDENSDGWATWTKPRQAAQKAIALVESTTNRANDAQEEVDASPAEVKAALAPIKSFLTRLEVGPDTRRWILGIYA